MAAGSYQGRRGLQTRTPQAIPSMDSIPSILKVFDSLSSVHVVGLVTIASHDGLTDAKGWWTARHLATLHMTGRDDACNLVWRLLR